MRPNATLPGADALPFPPRDAGARAAGPASGPPHTWLERRWHIVAYGLWAASTVAFACVVLFHPSIISRVASSDGTLEDSSRALMYALEAGAFLAGAILAALAAASRPYSAFKERLVLGAGFSLLSLVASVMLMESGLRLVHARVRPLEASRHYFYAHDPDLGWRHRARSVATFKNERVSINSIGLRDDEPAPPGGAGDRLRMLVLGDSQVFGDGVGQDQTFVEILQAELGVDAINAGVIGYGTDQQLLYYERDGARVGANLTIVGLNAYDLRDNISTHVRSGYEKPVFAVRDGALALTNVPVSAGSIVDRAQRWLNGSSHLYATTVRLARGSAERQEDAREARRGASRPAETVFPSTAQFPRSLEATRLILDRLAASVRRTGGTFAVMFLPYEMDFGDDPAYRERSDELVAALQRWGAEGNYPVLDLRGELRGGPARELFLDTMHFSAKGHRAVANAARTWLVSSNLVPAPGSK